MKAASRRRLRLTWRQFRNGPWLELGVILLAFTVTLLVLQGQATARRSDERTRQLNALTAEVSQLKDQLTLLQLQAAIKDRTIADLTAALIASGGNPTPILARQQQAISPPPSHRTSPTATPSPTSDPRPSPTRPSVPSPAPSATPSPTPSPSPTPTCALAVGRTCVIR